MRRARVAAVAGLGLGLASLIVAAGAAAAPPARLEAPPPARPVAAPQTGPMAAPEAGLVAPPPSRRVAPLTRPHGTPGYAAIAGAATGPGRILIGDSSARGAPLLLGAVRQAHLAHAGMDVLAVRDVAAALAAYRASGLVTFAEADRPVVAASNDPLYPLQWYLHAGATGNSIDWQPSYPGAVGTGVLVAIIDTGFEAGGNDQPLHVRTDLERNFLTGGTDVSDDNGHGTFIANLIGEDTDNGTGAAGIAPGASIVPIKALGADGTGDLSVVAAAIDYAQSIGAQVINLSLAGDQSPALCAAVTSASASSIVIAASGNDATGVAPHPLDYPAACPGALAVGSVAYDGSRPAYANTGCGLAVVAPGGDDLQQFDPATPRSDWVVQQTYDTNHADGQFFDTFQYFQEEGTSMASAEVAGEAADLIGLGTSTTAAGRLIVATARPLGATGVNATFGAGAVDLSAAVSAARSGRHPQPPLRGYRQITAAGSVHAFGDTCATAGYQGQISGPVSQPVVGGAATPDGRGYWLVASDGGIFTFGDASFLGSTGALHLTKPIVGMAPTPDGRGYWLVASDGGIFTFGDASFLGSTGALHLTKPIVGMAPTPDGRGYSLVASDGGIFTFGDATFLGSTGALHLTKPIVGMAPTPDGRGYWLVASDGGIFTFGDASFLGSTGALHLTKPIVGMVASGDGLGYTLTASDGGVFTFGDAAYHGVALTTSDPTVAILPEPWPSL